MMIIPFVIPRNFLCKEYTVLTTQANEFLCRIPGYCCNWQECV